MDTQQLTSPHRRRLYAYFMDIFRKSAGDAFEERWNWLTAAHIVGQNDLRLHLHSHAVMLAFAASTRDWPEVFGQLVRLALVPVGHLAGKLPAGNIGRSTVNAFRPMPLDAAMRHRIGAARRRVEAQLSAGEAPSIRW